MNRDIADAVRSAVAAIGAAAVSLGWITADDSASAVEAVTAIAGGIAMLGAVGYSIYAAVVGRIHPERSNPVK